MSPKQPTIKSSTPFSTHGTKVRQFVLFTGTSIMTLIFLGFFIYRPSFNTGLIVLLEMLIVLFVNYHFRSYFDLTICDDQLLLKNIWGEKRYPLDAIKGIKRKRFPFPYPFNPYLVLLTQDDTFIIKIDNPMPVHLSKGGVNSYIQNLVDTIQAQKKQDNMPMDYNGNVTIKKLKVYESYKGDVDGFSHASQKERSIITENEFSQIASIIQDMKLVEKNLAAAHYKEQLFNKLTEVCDSRETIDYFWKMSANL